MYLYTIILGMIASCALTSALPSPQGKDIARPLIGEGIMNTTDVAIVERGPTNIEKRQPPPPNPDFVYMAVYTTAAILYPELIGVANLVGSVWSAVGRCLVNPLSFDCLFGAADAVFNVWNMGFFDNDGVDKRSASGRPIYAVRNSTHTPNPITHSVSHIPILPHERLMRAATKYGNNGTWVHIATTYYNDTEAHYIYHRLAHQDDLGKANDGIYHHFRAMPSSATLTKLKPRAEDDDNGVVVDYLWKDGNSQLWDDAQSDGNPDNGDYFGSTIANWMEDNSAEVTCATVGIGIPVSEGSDPIEQEDQGVLAYGWNDTPFDFNGLAGGWVDSCY
jgi:hypothetical protein